MTYSTSDSRMQIIVWLCLCLCSWMCMAQDAEQDILRLPRRTQTHFNSDNNQNEYETPFHSKEELEKIRLYLKSQTENIDNRNRQQIKRDSSTNFESNVGNNDNRNKQHEVNNYRGQIHKDLPTAFNDEFYDSNSSEEEYQNKDETKKNKNESTEKRSKTQTSFSSKNIDSDTGASNNHLATQFVLPPDSFMNSMRFIENQGYFSTPAPQIQYFSSLSPFDISGSSGLAGAGSNINYVTTPAPINFDSTQAPRIMFVSSPSNYQQGVESKVSYASTPAPNVHKNSDAHSQYYGSQQSQQNQNNIQYVSTPSSNLQYYPSSSPSLQFISQISNQNPFGSQVQYLSTPSTKILSTPSPQNFFVSTPAHFVSSPSSISYGNNNPSQSNNRINHSFQSGQTNSEKQMHIDHFDNAMSGIRNPKLTPQTLNNFFVTSTPSPLIISSTETPNQSKNEENWRSGLTSINNLFNQKTHGEKPNSVDEKQNQFSKGQYFSNNLREPQITSHEIELANNLMLSLIQRSNEKQNNNKNYQRDLNKETDVIAPFSYGDFGWKLNPKKSQTTQNDIESVQENRGSFSITSPPNTNNNSPSPSLRGQVVEYRPYPDNPFLNHISFATTSPPVPMNSGSIRSISFQPDNNQQHNVNVGYSIGFGSAANNEGNKNDGHNPNKFSFSSNIPSFTTSSSLQSTGQSDIIKGVQISQVNIPEVSFAFKEPHKDNNIHHQKENGRYQDSKSSNFASGLYQELNSENPFSSYKQSQSFKNRDEQNSGKLSYQYFINSPKTLSFNSNSPNVLSTYHGSDDSKGQSYKWTNIGAGVEVSTTPYVDAPKTNSYSHLSTQNSLIFFNNPNDVVTRTPFFYTTPKDNQNERTLQNFDHENALKNIQPIGISNVVSHSSTPVLQKVSLVTISPEFSSNTNDRDSFQSQVKLIQTEQLQSPPSILNAQYILDQGLSNAYKNYKISDESFKSKNNDFLTSDSNEIRAYVFGNPRDQKAFESNLNIQPIRQSNGIPTQYSVNPPQDMIGYSSNTINRQASQVEYVPSETFRNSHDKSSYFHKKNDQDLAIQSNPNQGGRITRNQHDVSHPSSEDNNNKRQNNFHRNLNDFTSIRDSTKINQDMSSHNLEPELSNSNRLANPSYNADSENEKSKIINDETKNSPKVPKLITLNGIPVSNPYNIDLRVLSDLINGKSKDDELRLEPVQDKISRHSQDSVDISELRKILANYGQSRLEINDEPESKTTPEFISSDFQNTRNMKKQKSIKYISDELLFADASRPFQQVGHELKNDDKTNTVERNIPNIASEQLQSSVQSIASAHQIGAVIDQSHDFNTRTRNNDNPIAMKLNAKENGDSGSLETDYMENDFEDKRNSGRGHRMTESPLEKSHYYKRINSELGEPYPLLKPPRPMISKYSSVKKSDKRPVTFRQRVFGMRLNRPSKSINDDSSKTTFGIQTNLRPPPVVIRQVST